MKATGKRHGKNEHWLDILSRKDREIKCLEEELTKIKDSIKKSESKAKLQLVAGGWV